MVSAMQIFVNRMHAGELDAIMEGLKDAGSIFRCNAIIAATVNDIHTDEVIQGIRSLKADNDTPGMGIIPNSSFAIAALHMLGAERYQGNDKDILRLIESNYAFARDK